MKKKYDWLAVQTDYDNGLSQSQLITKYGMSARSIFLAIKRGDFRSRTISEGVALQHKNNPRSDYWYKQHGANIANTIREKVANGTWHTSLARHMHINYNGVDLHGSWEVAYAKFLDSNNIRWERCNDSFSYLFDGKNRKYTPDFYLIDTGEYVEIKGYKTEKDSAKWSQFPHNKKLTILMQKELLALGLQIFR